MKFIVSNSLILLLSSIFLSACSLGITTPDIKSFTENEPEERVHENQVINQIKCELHHGFDEAISTFNGKGDYAGKSVDWLNSWGVKVTLKLAVDEKSAFNPGVTFFHNYQNALTIFHQNGNITTPQNFSLALGAAISADATRTEIIDFTYGVAQLRAEGLPCEIGRGLTIDSNLKIREFIMSKAFIAAVPGTVGADQGFKPVEVQKPAPLKSSGPPASSPGPFGTFSDEIQFVITYGGGVTPTWKFVDVTGSSTNPLFNGSRVGTDDATISIGKGKYSPDGTFVLDAQSQAIHNALLTGQATAGSIQSQAH